VRPQWRSIGLGHHEVVVGKALADPLPAPAKQTHCAESGSEERERRGERRCGYLGENSKGGPCPFGGKCAGMHYEGDDFDLNQ
jgi:hypothetical protein